MVKEIQWPGIIGFGIVAMFMIFLITNYSPEIKDRVIEHKTIVCEYDSSDECIENITMLEKEGELSYKCVGTGYKGLPCMNIENKSYVNCIVCNVTLLKYVN